MTIVKLGELIIWEVTSIVFDNPAANEMEAVVTVPFPNQNPNLYADLQAQAIKPTSLSFRENLGRLQDLGPGWYTRSLNSSMNGSAKGIVEIRLVRYGQRGDAWNATTFADGGYQKHSL